MTQQVYAPGQVWTYRNRPGEEASRLVIRAIEALPQDGEVIHIAAHGLNLRNHRMDGGMQRTLHHLAVSRGTLDRSVVALDGTLPDDGAWRPGYDIWTQAFVNGDAAVFESDLPAILDYIEKVIAASGEASH
ncbi:hypothetical protein FHW69_000551 [Luteibacter sp. Sphag1AF]|uniref:hypothetical protein n=1 Tax=Luteibacter sp. Sphag1AF TaxID=2587031 RepID=UPI001608994F|nr:hypothetical protein [Luteibacter sp. Sphag1AF]MBB3225961.1 hypothetical protein [Luteibacter sp. Sphag1AF]